MLLHLHHVPGRLRVCLAKLKRNARAAILLRAELIAIPGVKSVSINSLTGSIIVHYDRNGFEPEKFGSTLRRLGYIDEASLYAPCPAFRKADTVASAAANAVVKTLLGAVLEQCIGRTASTLIGLLI